MDVRKRGVCHVLLVIAGLVLITSADFQMNAIGNDEFRCTAIKDTIVDCQFKSYPQGGVVERGNKGNEWLILDDTALTSGTCKVTLSKKFLPEVGYLIACRVQIQSNRSWVEKELFFSRNRDLKIETRALTISAKLQPSNGTFDVSVTAPNTLTNCTFLVPGKATRNQGMISGKTCRANFINDVVPEALVARVVSAGNTYWALAATQGTDESMQSEDYPLEITTDPTEETSAAFFTPVLTFDNVPRSAGDVVKASCKAPKNYKVVWTLDSKELDEYECQSTEWPWSFQAGSYVATLEHKVTWRDNGRRLGCRLKTNSGMTRAALMDSQPLNVSFAPVLTSFTLKWLADETLKMNLSVAASPEPTVSWVIADLQGNTTATKETEREEGEYLFSMYLDVNTKPSDTLVLSLRLVNAIGSTTSQIRIGQAEDTTWLVVLSGVLGVICLFLSIVLLVLLVPRCCKPKLGTNSGSIKEGRGRCKAVESGIYATVDETAEYDDIWQPEYDDVDLPPAAPMRPTKS